MLWAVLAAVVSTAPVPAKVASTYDEAACADERPARADADLDGDDTNCSEAPPAVPAVLDCNDARVSLWLGEMIGSCDMPRPLPPGSGPAGVRAGGPQGGDPRLCNDGRCGLDSTPIRPLARSLDDLTQALGNAGPSLLFFPSSALVVDATRKPAQPSLRRLERPPRAI